MQKKIRWRALAALSAVTALALTGCSSGGDNGAGGDKEVIFVDAIGSNPPHLNSMLNTDSATHQIDSSIFDTIVEIDSAFNVYPSLATEWEVNADATQYTFKLRDDVKWHDGEPFTSADVKYNMEEVFKLHPLGAALDAVQESIETPDATTVIVKLKEPFAPYIEAMSSYKLLPKHLYEGTDVATNPANLAPIGTGPFKFTEFVEGDHITVVKNEEYWGGASAIDKIIFKIMPDANARVLALQSGEVDRITSLFLDSAQTATLAKDSNLYVSSSAKLPEVMTLFFNTRQGPLADAEVRKALYAAIDREAVSKNALFGMGTPSRGPIPAVIEWAADPSVDFTKQFAFDPEAAGKALDAAGYPKGADGKRFSLDIHVASSLPTFVATTEVVKSSLESIGVEVKIMAEDLNVYVDQVHGKNSFDMAVMSFASYEDPSLGVSRLYVCNPENLAFRNPTGMCDAELDQAFAAASQVADRDERRKLFAVAEKRVAELMHTVPLSDDMAQSVTRKDRWTGVDKFNSLVGFDWMALGVAK